MISTFAFADMLVERLNNMAEENDKERKGLKDEIAKLNEEVEDKTQEIESLKKTIGMFYPQCNVCVHSPKPYLVVFPV